MADSLLARKYFDGIYIPFGLLVVGTVIVKREWTAYAVLLGLVLGGWKYYNNRRLLRIRQNYPRVFRLLTKLSSPQGGPQARCIPGV